MTVLWRGLMATLMLATTIYGIAASHPVRFDGDSAESIR